MEFLKKYFFIILIWIFTIVIIIAFWGSGRIYMIFPALLTTVGYYLLRKANEGRNRAKNIINCSQDVIKEGLATVDGIIKSDDKVMLSPINNDKVVFYDILIERGKGDYSNLKVYNSNDSENMENQNFKQAKWSIIGHDVEWKPFYIEIEKNNNNKTSTEKIYVENPEYAHGKWVYDTNKLPKPTITTLGEANDRIKLIIEDYDKNQKIEQGRYIRYLERVIKENEKIKIVGTIEKIEKQGEISYNIKQGKDGVFIITNDEQYDYYVEENKQYIKGMVIFILGLLSMLTAFVWPWILESANTVPA
jgi:hypothetical protein